MNLFANINFKKLVVIGALALTASLFLVFSFNAYPVPAGDSQFFVVPAIQYRAGAIMASPLFPSEWEIDLILDPTGQRRFLFYPPFFPLIVSYLSYEASPVAAFLAIALINIAVLCLFFILMYYTVIRNKFSKNNFDWLSVFMMIFGLFALASSLAENGRPEVLARLWVILGLFVYYFSGKKFDWFCYGILLGLMFVTHPPAAIFSILILGILFGVENKSKDALFKISATTLLSVAFGLLLIGVGPFDAKETIDGTFINALLVKHGASQTNDSWYTVSNLISHYLASPIAPFYGIALILFSIASFYFFKTRKDKIKSMIVVLVSFLLLVLVIYKIVVPLGHMFYFALFSPIIFLVVISFSLESKRWLKILTILVFFLVSTGFLRTTALFPYFLKQDAGLDDARANYLKLVNDYKGQKFLVGITGGLWTLTEDYKNVYSYNFWPEKPKENTSLIFFQQRYSGMINPPEIKGCSIISNSFSNELPKIFGYKLSNTMPGYGYSAYSCM